MILSLFNLDLISCGVTSFLGFENECAAQIMINPRQVQELVTVVKACRFCDYNGGGDDDEVEDNQDNDDRGGDEDDGDDQVDSSRAKQDHRGRAELHRHCQRLHRKVTIPNRSKPKPSTGTSLPANLTILEHTNFQLSRWFFVFLANISAISLFHWHFEVDLLQAQSQCEQGLGC